MNKYDSWKRLVLERSCLFVLVNIAFLFVNTKIFAEVSIPTLSTRVTELTHTLSHTEIESLDLMLKAFERQKGTQIVVLIVPTTQPETIEQYSIRVNEAWKLGRKKVDDGVLLLIAKEDHTLRIEVGYGLEGVIPDVIAKRIVEEIIVPQFKQGNFYLGIKEGLQTIIKLINGEELPLPPPSTDILSEPNLVSIILLIILILILGRFGGVPLIMGSNIYYSGLGRSGFSGRSGGFSGGGGSFGGGGASGRW